MTIDVFIVFFKSIKFINKASIFHTNWNDEKFI
jgi:hypothetical protein